MFILCISQNKLLKKYTTIKLNQQKYKWILYLLTQRIVKLLIHIDLLLNLTNKIDLRISEKVLLYQILTFVIHKKHKKLIQQQQV